MLPMGVSVGVLSHSSLRPSVSLLPSVWLRLRAAPRWLIYQPLHQMWENNRSEKFSPAQQQWKEEKALHTDGGILISDLIDTSELKPEGKLFHTFRNVVSKPRLNSLTNFQQHCLERHKHRWELQPIIKKAIGLPSSQTYIHIGVNTFMRGGRGSARQPQR